MDSHLSFSPLVACVLWPYPGGHGSVLPPRAHTTPVPGGSLLHTLALLTSFFHRWDSDGCVATVPLITCTYLLPLLSCCLPVILSSTRSPAVTMGSQRCLLNKAMGGSQATKQQMREDLGTQTCLCSAWQVFAQGHRASANLAHDQWKSHTT